MSKLIRVLVNKKNRVYRRAKLFVLGKVSWFKVLLQYFEFKKSNSSGLPLHLKDAHFYTKDSLYDHPFDAHYIYHPAWASRVVQKINPKKHIDISSILSFSTQLSAFIPTDFYDYRPAELTLSNLKSEHADLQNLPFKDNSIESISCMHTIEHVGLGRYGDPIKPDADAIAITELIRVTKKGGSILFVTPVGKERIVFNAHRIYSYGRVIDMFSGCKLKEFKAVLDNSTKGLVPASSKIVDEQNYACGCFWFIKL